MVTSTLPSPTSLVEVPAAVDVVLADFFDRAVPRTGAISPVVADAAAAVRDFALNGGKRIRPIFVYAGWLCGLDATGRGSADADAADVLRVCGAVELVQACALIHDDVIDQSDTRRGNATVHRDFERRHRAAGWAGDSGHHGVSTAILMGDFALAWADDLLHDQYPAPDADAPDPDSLRPVPPAVARVWAAMRTEVLGGQYLDIVGEASGDESIDAAYRVMEFKTATYTVARPLELGATLAGAPSALITTLRSVGRDLGIAFQLRDDMLGAFGDPAQTGKPSGEDLVSGKRTALLAVALARGDERDPAASARLRGLIGRELSEDELATARTILVESGAVAEIEDQINELRDAALASLAAADIGSRVRDELTVLADRIAHRSA